MPAEHGAWVVMLVPIMLTWLALPPRPGPAILLVVAAASAWLAQSTAPSVLQPLRRAEALQWLSVLLGVFALASFGLLVGYKQWALVPIGLVAAVLAGVHLWMRGQVRGRRLDRSGPGELLGMAGLALTGPAAYVVSRGTLDWGALVIFGACVVFFSSGVLFVRMLLAWIRSRKASGATRWQVGRIVVGYHAVLAAGLLVLPAIVAPRAALLAIAAFIPAIVRALWGVATLSPKVPSFKRVGVLESVYAVWFGVMMAMAWPPATGAW
ncbi:MAG: YwiC-like family protein [Deltaproteobacteria bacterium]|nr:YwiC-like family protein [Deltaproteobacteria bacterium]